METSLSRAVTPGRSTSAPSPGKTASFEFEARERIGPDARRSPRDKATGQGRRQSSAGNIADSQARGTLRISSRRKGILTMLPTPVSSAARCRDRADIDGWREEKRATSCATGLGAVGVMHVRNRGWRLRLRPCAAWAWRAAMAMEMKQAKAHRAIGLGMMARAGRNGAECVRGFAPRQSHRPAVTAAPARPQGGISPSGRRPSMPSPMRDGLFACSIPSPRARHAQAAQMA